jgi:hypothetical protein
VYLSLDRKLIGDDETACLAARTDVVGAWRSWNRTDVVEARTDVIEAWMDVVGARRSRSLESLDEYTEL